jgi:hypothetical protein
MTFGAGVREERMVRRIWALIRASGQVLGLRSHINFRGTVEETRLTSVPEDATDPTVYAEGQLPPDGYSFQLEIDGDAAPAALLAVGVDTIPRRVRFGH